VTVLLTRRWTVPFMRVAVALAILVPDYSRADPVRQTKGGFEDKFRQLEPEEWPTPNVYRTASGAPGERYWQQRADYRIAAELHEAGRSISGRAEITYTNNSPDDLPYLWLLLDQNRFKRGSVAERTRTVAPDEAGKVSEASRAARFQQWEGGFSGLKVTDATGSSLPFTINDTLMRIELPQPIASSGGRTSFVVEWSFPLIETGVVGGRSGYECFNGKGQDGNCLFLGGQWFPRMAAYSDYEGWHTQQFLGAGEFALEFGDYDVSLTVPDDHIVAATGELANADVVLTSNQRQRLASARLAREPMYIVSPAEAALAERGGASGSKTWRFRASNVRDFAFASSRKFIWDAMSVPQQDSANPQVLAMSFYPKEAEPLWSGYSTKSIAHAIKVYGDLAFPYPYPTAQAVNGPVDGMEYPMITFNDPRPRKDGTIGEVTAAGPKNSLVGINVHEIGHIWFSMIVNTDERQWSWLDEGLNSYVQYRAEKKWDPNFLSRLGGDAQSIVRQMGAAEQSPIMTHSDSQLNYFNTTYRKTATALNILRETVLGPEPFDRAFREYACRWRFKRPTPYDFFRSMEEGSGTDLDWFWRGWFYSTDHVDQALDGMVQVGTEGGANVYQFSFRNVGGLAMPILLKLHFEDGTTETVNIPAQIWRYDQKAVTWQYESVKPIVRAEIDPLLQTSDTNRANNAYGKYGRPRAK